MAFLGRCYGCRVGNHEEHVKSFDTPPRDAGFVCGGGHCVCAECNPQMAHLDPGEEYVSKHKKEPENGGMYQEMGF